jgi:hypothetical protein
MVLHLQGAAIEPMTSPAGNVTLTIGITLHVEKWGFFFFFAFIADTNSKKTKF